MLFNELRETRMVPLKELPYTIWYSRLVQALRVMGISPEIGLQINPIQQHSSSYPLLEEESRWEPYQINLRKVKGYLQNLLGQSTNQFIFGDRQHYQILAITKTRLVSLVRLPREEEMLPCKKLKCKYSNCNFLSSLIAWGIEPDNWFHSVASESRFTRLLIPVGR